MSAIVIIGTGLAGYTTAREFRKLDASTPLHLISRDDGSFYSKPILSNALALKKIPAQIALNTAADMERQLAATVSTHSLASSIDTDRAPHQRERRVHRVQQAGTGRRGGPNSSAACW